MRNGSDRKDSRGDILRRCVDLAVAIGAEQVGADYAGVTAMDLAGATGIANPSRGSSLLPPAIRLSEGMGFK
jgi:hypothetical protein